MTAPARPVLRWFGGKWKLAPWILSHFPPHRVYVEPFGGAGSVLMRKPRSYCEVYNDVDGEVVNLFRVLRDPGKAARLVADLELTPFARDEFVASYEPTAEPIENARRLIMRSFMGFGSNGHNAKRKTGFRANSNRSGTTPAHDWRNYPETLHGVIDRLRGIVIENRDYAEVIAAHDGDQTLIYADPPYVMETRSRGNVYDAKYGGYNHDFREDADHERLAAALHASSSMVILSGYPSPLYDRLFGDWRVITTRALADGARERSEVLWLNARAASALQPTLLEPSA